MADAVFRPKSYLPPVPEGPAGFVAPPQLPSDAGRADVEAHLARLARDYWDIYRRVFTRPAPFDIPGNQGTYAHPIPRIPFEVWGNSPGSQGSRNGYSNGPGVQGAQRDTSWEFLRGFQGNQGSQGLLGSEGVPGGLGLSGGIGQQAAQLLEVGRLYSIPELEIIGHALGCPYLFMAVLQDGNPFGVPPGWLDFIRQGRFVGFHGFNTGQLPGHNPDGSLSQWGRVATPEQCAIRATVSYFCDECNKHIYRWESEPCVEGHARIVAADCAQDNPGPHRITPRRVRVRIDRITVAGMTFQGSQGE